MADASDCIHLDLVDLRNWQLSREFYMPLPILNNTLFYTKIKLLLSVKCMSVSGTSIQPYTVLGSSFSSQ